MRRRLPTLLAAAVIGLACPGCFVIDELDSGMDLMKEHSPKQGGGEAEPEPAAGPSAASRAEERTRKLQADAKDWWKKARTPTSKEPAADASPGAAIVSCRIGGAIRFMSRSDCLSQGGRS